MIRADVIELITENESAHGVHIAATETARMVYCTVKSASRREYYEAFNDGMSPEYVFRLEMAEDYQNERIARYHGQKYRIIRHYLTDDGGVELTVERSDVNGEN